MTHTIHKVREFHEAFGHTIADAPTVPTQRDRLLRIKLIASELLELCDAAGIYLEARNADRLGHVGCEEEHHIQVFPAESADVDLVECADALGDLDYVVQGGNLIFGFPAEAIVTEIHASNMTKLGADGRPVLARDGKVTKGPNYRPPNLEPILTAATNGDTSAA